MGTLKMLFCILAVGGLLISFSLLVVGLQYIAIFHWRPCKYCNHNLKYKGFKGDEQNGHYLFYCPHCGAWEEVPKQEFIKDLDKGFNPNEFSG